jgi:hypothetical protein
MRECKSNLIHQLQANGKFVPVDNRKALDLAVDERGRMWMITWDGKVWRRDD